MAVDTILKTATPLKTNPPTAVKQPDMIDDKKTEYRLSSMVGSLKSTEPGQGSEQVNKTVIKSSTQPLIVKSEQKNDLGKSLKSKKDESNTKSEKVKESSTKSNVVKANQNNTRNTQAVKGKENTKNVKISKNDGTNSTNNSPKESGKEKPSQVMKTNSKNQYKPEDDACSDVSSTEYVTFDAYIDQMSNGRSTERKYCFNRLYNSSPSHSKPSSPSSSILSISTINIDETPSSSLQNSTFDAKTFRTSLLEASEIPPHNLYALFRDKANDFSHVSAWNPSVITSQSLDSKNCSSPKHRLQNPPYLNSNIPKIQRSLTMTQSFQKEDNNSFSVPAVYDRLATLGRYRDFCFQHRPDDWQWYMKEYSATHTVGRVGHKKKKRQQIKFGVDVPDPYATMGKKVVTSSNLDSRQNTFHQGASVTSSVSRDITSKERQSKKQKSGEDATTTDSNNKDGGTTATASKKDRSYPVLTPTREANTANGNSTKSSKSEKAVRKSGTSNVKEKRQPNTSSNNNGSNITSSSNRPTQTTHPHHHHASLPQLSGEDVRLNLISSKIPFQAQGDIDPNTNQNVDDSGNEDEEERLWENPFPSNDEANVNINPSVPLTGEKGSITLLRVDPGGDAFKKESIAGRKEEAVRGKSKEINLDGSQPALIVSDGKQKKNTIEFLNKDNTKEVKTPTQSQHLKAELEREKDGSLMVKISVFKTEKNKTTKDETNDIPVKNGRKPVQICREETVLMGKELHEKLKLLNNNENILPSKTKNEDSGIKDSKTPANKTVIFQIENNPNDSKQKTTGNVLSDTEHSLQLQGLECTKKKSKSKTNLKQKNGVDFITLGLDKVDSYPKQRTAYQEIDFASQNILKSKPTIKYTKSKPEEKGSNINLTPHNDGTQKESKQSKGKIHQTVLFRSSTVHLTTQVDIDDNEDMDVISGRNVHQVYPLNDWKKTVDEGKCGFIVKSIPTEVNSPNKKTAVDSDFDTNYNITTKKSHHRKESTKGGVFLTTKSYDEALYKDGAGDLLHGDNDNENDIPKTSYVSVDNLNKPSLPFTDDVGKKPTSHCSTRNQDRRLYRPKSDLPLIKISEDEQDFHRKDDNSSTNTRIHFPPITTSDNTTTDKQKALDDLFVSGVNHKRSRSRENGFVSRKRPISLDRGLIDDLVRYHTETTCMGFKNKQQLQTHLQTMHPHHHPSSQHHNQLFPGNSHPHTFKTQPEESPALTPSVQKLNKVHSNLRPRPTSPGDERNMASTSSTNRDLDHKRQLQIYAHVRKSTSSSVNASDDKSTANKQQKVPEKLTASKQQNIMPDLQQVLGLNRLS